MTHSTAVKGAAREIILAGGGFGADRGDLRRTLEAKLPDPRHRERSEAPAERSRRAPPRVDSTPNAAKILRTESPFARGNCKVVLSLRALCVLCGEGSYPTHCTAQARSTTSLNSLTISSGRSGARYPATSSSTRARARTKASLAVSPPRPPRSITAEGMCCSFRNSARVLSNFGKSPEMGDLRKHAGRQRIAAGFNPAHQPQRRRDRLGIDHEFLRACQSSDPSIPAPEIMLIPVSAPSIADRALSAPAWGVHQLSSP